MSRTQSAGMFVLKLGALALALGVGGWLVVNAQRAADQDAGAREQPEAPQATPETPPGDQKGVVAQPTVDPKGTSFLSTSKSAYISDLPGGETKGVVQPTDPRVFLPTSKSLVIEDPRTVGLPAAGEGQKAPDPRGFFPSSKFGTLRASDVLPKPAATKKPAPAKPAPKDQFIFGSKSGHPLPRGIVPVADPPKNPDGQD